MSQKNYGWVMICQSRINLWFLSIRSIPIWMYAGINLTGFLQHRTTQGGYQMIIDPIYNTKNFT